MPFLTPKRSGVHRTACFALYKALLHQASRVAAVPLPFHYCSALRQSSFGSTDATSSEDTTRQENAHFVFRAIRHQFRDGAALHGNRRTVYALELGYEALSVLRSTTAPLDDAAFTKFTTSLRQLFPSIGSTSPSSPNFVPASPSSEPLAVTPSGKTNAGPRVWRHPSTSAHTPHILLRPLPRSALTGKRNVPRFVTTQGVPFLRIKKPQPAYLSRIIRDTKKLRQRRIDRLADYRLYWMPLAACEDSWETLLRQTATGNPETREAFRKDMTDGDERAKFLATFYDAQKQLNRQRTVDFYKAERWAERLWKILKEERELKWEEEGVLDPLRGRSKERKEIVARQRREKRTRNREKAEQQGGE